MKSFLGTVLEDAVIACHGNENRLYEYIKTDADYVFFFTGNKPKAEKAFLTYRFYDYIEKHMKDAIKPLIITRFVPMGLKNREVILDLEGSIFKKFNIEDNPKVSLLTNKKIKAVFEPSTIELLEFNIKEIIFNKES